MNEIKILDLRKHKGRLFYTTDMHGCYDLLHEKLKDVAFDSTKDILIVGGDLCDRGPDSKYVLDYLNEPWLYCIRANHEQLLIEAYEEEFRGWATNCLLSNGGTWVADLQPHELTAIYQSFKSLPLAIELLTPTEKIGIIHAEVPRGCWNQFKRMSIQELEWEGYAIAQWARTKYDKSDERVITGVDFVLSGHTPTKSGEIERLGNQFYCDLGSFFFLEIKYPLLNYILILLIIYKWYIFMSKSDGTKSEMNVPISVIFDKLSYDKYSGNLFWKGDSRNSGEIAGYCRTNKSGITYIVVGMGYNGKVYKFFAHRIAWLLMTEVWPTEIDHINGDGKDNRWENLKDGSRTDNNKNHKRQVNNSSGLPGVSFMKSTGKW